MSRRPAMARSAGATALIAGLSSVPAAYAQEGVPVQLDTIYVTGEKMQRDLKDTASSVTVIGGTEIETEKRGKDEIRTVIAGVPNVVYADNVSTPIIRGMNSEGPHTGANAFFAGAVPRATINLDGHYLSYNEFYFGATSAWDLADVEVFRGPQTTSQGANAIGGAIVVNTRNPVFNDEGAFQLEAGNHGHRRASLMWNKAFSDEFAGRFTFDHSQRDTFIDYIGKSFVQNSIGQNFASTNARAKFLWAPKDIAGLEAKLTFSHSEMKRPSAEGASPRYEDLQSIAMFMPGWKQTVSTAIADVTYDLGGNWTLSNKLQYSRSDADRRVGVATAGDADVRQHNYTNDLRLSYGTLDDTLSGFVGLYAAYTKQHESLNQGGMSVFDDQKHNTGLYGEANWRFAPRWMLTGGLRYQRDHIRRKGDVSHFFANSDVDYDTTFDEFLPKISLSYQPNEDVTFGALYSEGYNPGGTSLDFATSKEWADFSAEGVRNYELFARANMLDGRLFLTGNLFYMDYSNYQQNVTQFVDGLAYMHTISADKARSYGLELSADYQARDDLKLTGSLGLLRTKFQEFKDYPAFVGNEFARAPSKTFTIAANWQANDKLSLGANLRYRDGYFSEAANIGANRIGSSTTVDLNASYQLTETSALYGYVNNVFDQRAPALLDPARGDVVFSQGSMNAPRMIGIGIRATF